MAFKRLYLKLFATLLAFFVVTSVFAEKLPKIVFDKTSIDIGEVKIDEKKSFEFTFTNKGKGKLVITRVDTGCGCTDVEFSKNFYSKGKKGTIKVIFDAKNFQPSKVKKTITVFSNSKKASQTLEFNVTIVN